MELSIICPTWNEIRFIDQLVRDLCVNDGLEKEVLILDGGSTDGTVERVKELQKLFSNLVFIANPRRTSTAAFNIGFKTSKGEYIAFVGAHARYSPNYFKAGVDAISSGICDAVGGPLEQKGVTATGRAIAYVMSSKAGVGNTEFRTSKERKYVDSVAFAIYRRSMIDKVGLMDESLPVNQDDEFHYRVNSMGYKIMMIPEMSSTYFVRDSYIKLLKQYFRYGLYKPMVLKKVKGAIRYRHVIPTLFVIYLLSLPLAAISLLWLTPLLFYFILSAIIAFKCNDKLLVKILCLPVFPILHIGYGTGFLLGLLKK